jgi:hypothetical protein
MGQTPDQIADHIERKRQDLRSNLEELGDKAKSAVDWREQFRKNPAAFMAVGLGSGLLLARVIGGSKVRRKDRSLALGRQEAPGSVGQRKAHVLQAWDDIQSALVGVVAAKVTDTLADVVPGFRDQLAARDGKVHQNSNAANLAKH